MFRLMEQVLGPDILGGLSSVGARERLTVQTRVRTDPEGFQTLRV